MAYNKLSKIIAWGNVKYIALNKRAFGPSVAHLRMADQRSGTCCLKVFLIWISGSPFVKRSVTICAIFIEGITRNNSVK